MSDFGLVPVIAMLWVWLVIVYCAVTKLADRIEALEKAQEGRDVQGE